MVKISAARILKREKLKEKKNLQKLNRRKRVDKDVDKETFFGLISGILFYFVRTMAARGVIFFLVCIIITLYKSFK